MGGIVAQSFVDGCHMHIVGESHEDCCQSIVEIVCPDELRCHFVPLSPVFAPAEGEEGGARHHFALNHITVVGRTISEGG